ncbi:MAG: hypothetical protein ACPGRX_02740, partial [Bdellovibrionales bacterium]
MSEPVAAAKNNSKIKGQESEPDVKTDIRALRAQNLRDKAQSGHSSLGALKISAEQKKADDARYDFFTGEQDNEPVLLLSPANAPVSMAKTSALTMAAYIAGAALTTLWIGFCAIYALTNGVSLAPAELGLFVTGILLPPAIYWMVLAHLHKRSDVQHYAQSLRQELQTLLFPSEETASLINKDVERLCRQAAEVSTASKAVLKSLQRARQGLRTEIRDFSGVSKKAEFHIDRLSETLTERSAKLLTLTEEIEQRTATIDERTQAGAEAWDSATLHILERAAEMETAMGRGADKLLEAADASSGKTKDIEAALQASFDSLNETV